MTSRLRHTGTNRCISTGKKGVMVITYGTLDPASPDGAAAVCTVIPSCDGLL